jgi:hypothetical protein
MSRIYSEILKSSSFYLLAKAVKLLSRTRLARKWNKKGRESGGKGNDGLVSGIPENAGTNTWQTLEEMDEYKETSAFLLLII